MPAPTTLFSRIALTTALALLAFVLLTGLLVFRFILLPLGQQAADDLAALLVLSAQTWVELPPDTRPDFETELERNHRLALRTAPPSAMEPLRHAPPYLRFLSEALAARLGKTHPLYRTAGPPEHYWAVVPAGGRTLYFGFTHERIGTRPPLAFVGILVGAGAFILATTLLLVRHISRPLERFGRAVQELGHRGTTRPLPETGPRELALLARKFNELGGEIRRLVDNRTVLLGGLSHDLRTPLARMALALELLRGCEDETLVTRLKQDLDEMDRLVRRTLELARALHLEADDAPKRPLNAVVSARIETRAPQQQVALKISGGCRRPVAERPLGRILDNVLDNAFRYGAPPVEVRLECTLEGDRLWVLDRGPGIPENERERLFEPFHRLEPSRNRDTGGSGLGLAVARQLAELHGWRIRLQNRPGGGLAVCIELPP